MRVTRPRSPSGSRLRKTAFAGLTIAIAGVLAVAIVEVGGRLVLWARHRVPGHAYGLWMHDDELGAIHAPHAYNQHASTNDAGFRGREDVLDPKPPGSLRIVCYGGSTTFGYDLADGSTWPEQLQELLRRRPGRERDQVLNGGHVAWSLGHLLARARRDLPRLRPDFVLLYSGINEELNVEYLTREGRDVRALLAGRQWGVFARNLGPCRWLNRHSITARLVSHATARVEARRQARAGRPPAPPDDRSPQFLGSWPLRNYLAVLQRFDALIRENGGTPVFVVECGVDPARTGYLLRYSAVGAERARELGMTTCDPRPAFAEAESPQAHFMASGIHPTPDGARLLAERVLACLEPLLPSTTASARAGDRADQASLASMAGEP